MKFAFLICSLLSGLVSCNRPTIAETEYLANVGDITYNAALDSSGFQPCHSDLILQYYNFGMGFKGEKAAIDSYFISKFEPKDAANADGYITIRFIVNCEGEACWFRMEEMDLEYRPKQFETAIAEQLLVLTKNLEGWKVAEYEGKRFDYYQYLTFNIIDGHIIEVLP